MELPGIGQAASAARAWVEPVIEWAKQTGSCPPNIDAYTVQLIVSELVTNALVHSVSGEDAGGRVLVRLEVGPDGLRISVLDQGPRTTPCRRVEQVADHGRGLEIVEALAADHGQVSTKAGRRSWALIA